MAKVSCCVISPISRSHLCSCRVCRPISSTQRFSRREAYSMRRFTAKISFAFASCKRGT